MRPILALALALLAAPAMAQTDADRAEAERIIADSVALGGFPEDQNAAMTECFTSRMTETDVAAFIAAEGDDAALQDAGQAMEAHSDVLLCVAEVLE